MTTHLPSLESVMGSINGRGRGSFTWTTLYLPAPISPEAGRAAIQALAGLSGAPRVVLEALGCGGRVSWRLGADEYVTPRILAALLPHLPGLRSELSPHALQSGTLSQAGAVGLPGHRATPLDTGQVEPVTRSVLAALAQARNGEVVRLQVILGARLRPRRLRDGNAGSPAPIRRDQTAKLGEYRFGCTLRIAADARTPERTRRLIDGVTAGLRGLEAPGVRLSLRRTSTSAVEGIRSPFAWPLELGVSEVAAVLGWPIAKSLDVELPGVPSRHPVRLPVHKHVPSQGRILGVSSLDPARTVAISPEDSLRHLHLLGPTGVGKSTLMANLALRDIQAGHGVVVIDPKGDLVEDLLARIPDTRREDVVVLDPTDEAPVGINGLGGTGVFGSPDLAADVLLGVFHSLYADAWGPRTHDILHASLLTLARRGDASLVMVPLLLTNPGFRRSVVGRVAKADPMGLGSFWAWYESISEAERTQAIAPLMNKLRPILMRPGLRAVFGQRTPVFQMADVFTKRRILLVSLSRGSLGPEAAQLLGSVVVALLWQAAQGRVAVSAAHRRRNPVFVHVDEVQDYLRLPGDLGEALAQARGLGVGFTLAHQHLGQLPNQLREAVMANARSRVTFGLSAKDARDIAATTSGQVDAADFQTLPVFQAYASLLVGGSSAPWCSLATQPLPPASVRPDAIRAASRARYGRPLDEVEQDLLSLMQTGTHGQTSDDVVGRRRPHTPPTSTPKGGQP